MSEIASRAVLAEPTGNKAAAILAPAGQPIHSVCTGTEKQVFNPKPSKCARGKLLPRYPGTFPRNPGVKSAVGECRRAGMGWELTGRERMEGNFYCRKWSWEVVLMAFSGAQLGI